MASQVNKITVWSAPLDDRPGAAAEKLRYLADVGTDLQLVLAHRGTNGNEKAVLFVAPIRNRAEVQAAESAGFAITSDLICVRVEGSNKPGLGSRIAGTLADNGINLREVTGVVAGKKYVSFIAFDNSPEADKGIKALKRAI